jgi:hypothetical protein
MMDGSIQIDLFDLEVARPSPGEGCAQPIGRLGGRRRAPHRPRVRPPSTAVVLREFRIQMLDELGALSRTLRRMEHLAGEQAARRASDSENLHGLLKRVASIERALELTQLSQPARASRRRPLGTT